MNLTLLNRLSSLRLDSTGTWWDLFLRCTSFGPVGKASIRFLKRHSRGKILTFSLINISGSSITPCLVFKTYIVLMWARIDWNESVMWGRTASRTSRIGQFSSAVLGITRDTDLPACTIRICLLNMRWKGNTWQKISGETSGSVATSSKSSGGSFSKSFANFALLGVLGVFGVTGPISVIKNCMWSATCCFFFPFSKFNWVGQLLNSLSSSRLSSEKKAKLKSKWNLIR